MPVQAQTKKIQNEQVQPQKIVKKTVQKRESSQNIVKYTGIILQEERVNKDVQFRRSKKKITTEPNSPRKNEKGIQLLNNHLGSQIIIKKDIPIKISANKLNLIRSVIGNSSKIKQNKRKSSNKLQLYNYHHNLSQEDYLQNSQINIGESNFLPNLNKSNHYSNSQIFNQHFMETKLNQKELLDMSCQQSQQYKINDFSYHKKSSSQDRKKPILSINPNIHEFNKVFIPYTKRSFKLQKSVNDPFKDENLDQIQQVQHRMQQMSPIRNKKFLADYNSNKNIGKIQPIQEIKNINEQVIRNKIYRGFNENYHIKNEITSPTSQQSPLYLNLPKQEDKFKPLKSVPWLQIEKSPQTDVNRQRAVLLDEPDSNKRFQKYRCVNLQFFFVTNFQGSQQEKIAKCQSGQIVDSKSNRVVEITQFHQRNNSVSSEIPREHYPQILQHPTFNTIEEVLRGSHDYHVQKLSQNYQIKNEQNNQEYLDQSSVISQLNHHVRTVASKQMPKCFRMSKFQISNFKMLHKNQKQLLQNKGNGDTNLFLDIKSQDVQKNLSNIQPNNNNVFEKKQNLSEEKYDEIDEEEKQCLTPAFNNKFSRIVDFND